MKNILNNKGLIIILLFLASAILVTAIDFTPQGNVNLRNIYNITGAKFVNATTYYGDGSQLTGIQTTVDLSNLTNVSNINGNTFRINNTGYFLDGVKITNGPVTVGFDNASTFVVTNATASPIDQIQNAIDYLNLTNTGGGKVLLKGGVYHVQNGAANFIDIDPFSYVASGKSIWIQGEGFGTILIKNNTNSGLFALGNGDTNVKDGVIISDFQMQRGSPSQTFRLANGQPPGNQHKNVFIERILADKAMNFSSRFMDLDANNLHINEVTLYGQLRGGGGSRFFASQNYVQGNDSTIASEVECIDINFISTDISKEAFVYANSLHDCYEQIIDNGNMFAHIFENHIEVNTPTDQGGITQAGDFGTVIGNTVEHVSNSRGGIEYHEGSNYVPIIGNIVIANHTIMAGVEIGSINNSEYNSAARGMRIDGENGTFIGNYYVGFNGTNIFQGSCAQDNQFIGNWFDPAALLNECHWGINLLGNPKIWVIQGADVNITRNLSINGELRVKQTANFTSDVLVGGHIKGTLNWSDLSEYPVGCPAGTFITQLNDSITCTAPSATSAASFNSSRLNQDVIVFFGMDENGYNFNKSVLFNEIRTSSVPIARLLKNSVGCEGNSTLPADNCSGWTPSINNYGLRVNKGAIQNEAVLVENSGGEVYNATNVSISIWFKIDGAGEASPNIFAHSATGTIGNRIRLFLSGTGYDTNGANLTFQAGNSTETNSSFPIFPDIWYNAVIVQNYNTSASYYLNGQLVKTEATSNQANRADLCLGANDCTGANALNGTIDEFRMWNRLLTSDEVQAIALGLARSETVHLPKEVHSTNERVCYDGTNCNVYDMYNGTALIRKVN